MSPILLRAFTGNKELLDHIEQQRSYAVQSETSGKLPANENGDQHHNQWQNELHKLCQLHRSVFYVSESKWLGHAHLYEGHDPGQNWQNMRWIRHAQGYMPGRIENGKPVQANIRYAAQLG